MKRLQSFAKAKIIDMATRRTLADLPSDVTPPRATGDVAADGKAPHGRIIPGDKRDEQQAKAGQAKRSLVPGMSWLKLKKAEGRAPGTKPHPSSYNPANVGSDGEGVDHTHSVPGQSPAKMGSVMDHVDALEEQFGGLRPGWKQKKKLNKDDSNPDEKADAKLGEDVEHLVERHFEDNKAAEAKEGHKLQVEKNLTANGTTITPAVADGNTGGAVAKANQKIGDLESADAKMASDDMAKDWDHMVSKLKAEGHSKESAEKIAGSINAKYVHHYPGVKKSGMPDPMCMNADSGSSYARMRKNERDGYRQMRSARAKKDLDFGIHGFVPKGKSVRVLDNGPTGARIHLGEHAFKHPRSNPEAHLTQGEFNEHFE